MFHSCERRREKLLITVPVYFWKAKILGEIHATVRISGGSGRGKTKYLALRDLEKSLSRRRRILKRVCKKKMEYDI